MCLDLLPSAYMCLDCIADNDACEEGLAPQPAPTDGSYPLLQLPGTGQLHGPAAARSIGVTKPTESLRPSSLPLTSQQGDSEALQCKSPIMPFEALRGVQWVAEAGKFTVTLACVICCNLLR